ncbi:retrovirus-related pol polyprotein from transposon TNT 1-94 [Tanacetum coccineum]
MMASSPICLLSKASKTKSWLWHRRLSHLNFGSINHLARHGLVRGLPKLKFEKDHLCSACALGKSSKKYILVIVDDYSRFTWAKCLQSKHEAPAFIINILKMIQVRLKETVRRIRLDNGTEFVNQTLREYYEKVGISHETSVARSPQQNGVVERRNRTLIEAARTMLIYAKAPLFLWAEAVATACYTQNRSMIRRRHGVCTLNIAVSTGFTPSSTTVDQDAPSPSNSHTTQGTTNPIISHDVEEDNHDNELHIWVMIRTSVFQFQSSSAQSSSGRPVSTRLQLHEQALFCYYDAFLTSVEPKNYKEALTQACWIEAMQEELHEFERLEVWELVPPPDKAFVPLLSGSIRLNLMSFRRYSEKTRLGFSLEMRSMLVVQEHAVELLAVYNFFGDNLTHIFTKALGRERIEFLINKLGMRSFTPDTLKQLADEVDE